MLKPKRSLKTDLLTWTTQVRIGDALKKRLEKKMKIEGTTSYTDIVRRAIEEYCK